MGIAINKGKKQSAIKAVVYGPEGIGKSTFASKWPKPLFLDIEGSTCRMDVERVEGVNGWSMALAVVQDLVKDPQGYKTLVFDTADWMDRMLQQYIIARAGKPEIDSIEKVGGGYGKGYVFAAEEWKKMFDLLDQLRERHGVNILMLAHAALRKFEQPDEMGAYDRWELKVHKNSSSLFKEWAELLLFANYKTLVVEVYGKAKAQGGKRVMFTTHHNCWDAKNRFGLKDELPFEFTAIAHLFDQTASAQATQAAKASAAQQTQPVQAAAAPAAAIQPAPVAKPSSGKPEGMTDQLWNLCTMHGVTSDEVLAVEYKRGVFPRGTQWQAICADYQNGNMCPAFDKFIDFINNKIRKGV